MSLRLSDPLFRCLNFCDSLMMDGRISFLTRCSNLGVSSVRKICVCKSSRLSEKPSRFSSSLIESPTAGYNSQRDRCFAITRTKPIKARARSFTLLLLTQLASRRTFLTSKKVKAANIVALKIKHLEFSSNSGASIRRLILSCAS